MSNVRTSKPRMRWVLRKMVGTVSKGVNEQGRNDPGQRADIPTFLMMM